VRENDRGWLYDGHADLIAIEQRQSFLIVKRHDLIRLVEQLVDRGTRAHVAAEARYKLYSRPDRPDQITMIETEKLRAILWEEWPKEQGDVSG
jgi:hypothetical protein